VLSKCIVCNLDSICLTCDPNNLNKCLTCDAITTTGLIGFINGKCECLPGLLPDWDNPGKCRNTFTSDKFSFETSILSEFTADHQNIIGLISDLNIHS
jgi:hypothetical protein